MHLERILPGVSEYKLSVKVATKYDFVVARIAGFRDSRDTGIRHPRPSRRDNINYACRVITWKEWKRIGGAYARYVSLSPFADNAPIDHSAGAIHIPIIHIVLQFITQYAETVEKESGRKISRLQRGPCGAMIIGPTACGNTK